jgi:hypothetical protein
MPVQINEVIIRTIVAPSRNGEGTAERASCEDPAQAERQREEDLLEQVLEIIKEKSQR